MRRTQSSLSLTPLEIYRRHDCHERFEIDYVTQQEQRQKNYRYLDDPLRQRFSPCAGVCFEPLPLSSPFL